MWIEKKITNCQFLRKFSRIYWFFQVFFVVLIRKYFEKSEINYIVKHGSCNITETIFEQWQVVFKNVPRKDNLFSCFSHVLLTNLNAPWEVFAKTFLQKISIKDDILYVLLKFQVHIYSRSKVSSFLLQRLKMSAAYVFLYLFSQGDIIYMCDMIQSFLKLH